MAKLNFQQWLLQCHMHDPLEFILYADFEIDLEPQTIV